MVILLGMAKNIGLENYILRVKDLMVAQKNLAKKKVLLIKNLLFAYLLDLELKSLLVILLGLT